ncbi:cell division protein FtsQ/DivIB [uncultured Eudoraea sp.]|jgi:cell division protein FtsQ|uniref:cell division protein FtsQ/DivIB n=1 Tax=uncultured Eudoraea sp. TaxID=1035614 RepID=UPI00262EF5C0|nr:cell division protein FtsQ/DivIB [uncultured Eudoraea sp.]
MKINWNYIKFVGLIICITGLYAFSGHRSDSRTVEGITLKFTGENNLYITQSMVNKLLIQNYGIIKNMPKEKLDLDTIEKVIEANEMVKSAQVYLTISGELTSNIVQRQPIGRVEGITKFYLDEEGKNMPLSSNHSARVPIITGNITGKSLEDVYVILNYINRDNFLRKNVIGIHIEDEENYQLKFRLENFVVNLGNVDDLEQKFNNFKAFYTKAAKDKTLENYNIVSLEFNNQVVCTKI